MDLEQFLVDLHEEDREFHLALVPGVGLELLIKNTDAVEWEHRIVEVSFRLLIAEAKKQLYS